MVKEINSLYKARIGAIVEGTIEGKSFKGRIMKDECGALYICQNTQSGSEPPIKLGYRYGWYIGDGSKEYLKSEKVIITKYKIDRSFNVKEHIMRITPHYSAYVMRGRVKVGCQTISNKTIRELVKRLKD